MSREELINNIHSYKKQLDTTFQFHCTECGKCCRNREDIILSPHDLFRAAKETGTTPENFLAQYCEIFIGNNSRFPVVHVKMDVLGNCVLLHNKHCTIHKAKPSVCAMFPVGRFVSLPKENPDSVKAQIEYFLQPITCGDTTETHTIREWIESFGMKPDDPAYAEWSKFIASVRPTLQEMEKKLNDDQMNFIWNVIVVFAYLQYDTNLEFLPQFLKNTSTVKTTLETVKWKI